MIKIYFGDARESTIYNTRVYFDNTYEGKWITSDIAKEIIKDIDKSEVISANKINSPVLGEITPLQLSGGTKTLLLMLNEPKEEYNASTCGNNCAKWILEIGKLVDVTINLGHVMDFGEGPFELYSLDKEVVMHNFKEYVDIATECL